MAVESHDGLLGPGDWAVMERGGVVHVAETVGQLPRGRALCGAVGTTFVISSPAQPAVRLCERCAALARRGKGPPAET
ncbi:MAG: hypothetical protein ACXVRI_11935 [Gaiellaceae bacterium]|jgi:hypothetical protein|nr:hypothetical protein [Gaiellaceae bacterium]